METGGLPFLKPQSARAGITTPPVPRITAARPFSFTHAPGSLRYTGTSTLEEPIKLKRPQSGLCVKEEEEAGVMHQQSHYDHFPKGLDAPLLNNYIRCCNKRSFHLNKRVEIWLVITHAPNLALQRFRFAPLVLRFVRNNCFESFVLNRVLSFFVLHQFILIYGNSVCIMSFWRKYNHMYLTIWLCFLL